MDTNKLTEAERNILVNLISAEAFKVGEDLERVNKMNGFADTEASKWRSTFISVLHNLKLKLQPAKAENIIDLDEFLELASVELAEKFNNDCSKHCDGGMSNDDYFLANCKYWTGLLNEQK